MSRVRGASNSAEKTAQQTLANTVREHLTRLKNEEAGSPNARAIVKDIVLLIAKDLSENAIALAFLKELNNYNDAEKNKNNALIVEALKTRKSVEGSETLTAENLATLKIKDYEVERVNAVLKNFGIDPITAEDDQETLNKKLIFEAIITKTIYELTLNTLDIGLQVAAQIPTLITELDDICLEKLGEKFSRAGLEVIAQDAVFSLVVTPELEKNETGEYTFNDALVDAIDKAIKKGSVIGFVFSAEDSINTYFEKNIKLIHRYRDIPSNVQTDWDRLIAAESLRVNNTVPALQSPQQIAKTYFIPAIADYIASKAHQGAFANLTHTFYFSKMSEKEIIISASSGTTKNTQLNNLSDYVTQPDGSVYYIERFDIPYYQNPSDFHSPNHFPDRNVPIARLVTISKISTDEDGKITHTLVDHKAYVMDENTGKVIFDLENDNHVNLAFTKSVAEIDKEINQYLQEKVPGYLPPKNFFQRAWDGIKNFAKDHPYITAFIGLTALIAIAVTITVLTLGAGAIPAAAAVGLGAMGLSSTAAGAAIVGFFSAMAAAGTAVATAVSAAVVAGVTYAAFGLVAAVINAPRAFAWLTEKLDMLFSSKKGTKSAEKPLNGGSPGVIARGLDVDLKKVKVDGATSSRRNSADSGSEENSEKERLLTLREQPNSQEKSSDSNDGSPVQSSKGKSMRRSSSE